MSSVLAVITSASRKAAIGFNGELHESSLGWQILGNGARTYNAVLMRFHGPDDLSPFGAGGLNAYAYAAGDPANHIDPSGHFLMPIVTGLFVAGAVAGVGGVFARDAGQDKLAEVLDWMAVGFGVASAVAMGGAAVRAYLPRSAAPARRSSLSSEESFGPIEGRDLYLKETRIHDQGDHLIVRTHGIPGGSMFNGELVNGADLGRGISAHIGRNKNISFIDLQSCYSANYRSASQAQQVANKTRLPTYGYKGETRDMRSLKYGMLMKPEQRLFVPQGRIAGIRSSKLNRKLHYQEILRAERYLAHAR